MQVINCTISIGTHCRRHRCCCYYYFIDCISCLIAYHKQISTITSCSDAAHMCNYITMCMPHGPMQATTVPSSITRK